MTLKQFFANKYRLSLLVILACLGTDVILHKGLSRVMLPASFTDKRSAQTFTTCTHTLISDGKQWLKAVNTPELMQVIPEDAHGLEWDVYFDTATSSFNVYHDSSAISDIDAVDLLEIYSRRKLKAGIWFDFKNLDAWNVESALAAIIFIRAKFHLENKILIESSAPQYLKPFCDSGFFTSYYVPYFNPYDLDEEILVRNIDTIASNLKNYPVSSLSGYYFQYPVLKKYFRDLPILTWTDKYNFSLIAYLFNARLENDERVKIILSPH